MEVEKIKDKQRYDTYWTGLHAHLLQSWQWGEIKRPRWKPLRLVIKNGETPIAIYSILIRELKIAGIRFGYVPKADAARDYLPEIWAKLAEYLRTEQRLAFVLFEFDQNTEDEDRFFRSLPAYDYSIQPQCTNIIDLAPDMDTLWASLKSKYRRNINKAKRDGVEVEMFAEGGDALDSFYSVMKDIFENTSYVMHAKAYFQKVWGALTSEYCAKIFIARHGKDIVGAYLVASDENNAFEFYGGVTLKGRDVEAGYLLKWEAMLAAKRAGKKSYDHWGVAPSDKDGEYFKGHELENISKFKAGFGGKDICFSKTRVMKLNSFKFRLFALLHFFQRIRIDFRKALK